MNLAEKKQNYIKRLQRFNQYMSERQRPDPRELIAEGVRKSTGITDENTVNVLTEKAVRAESYTKKDGYDTFLFGIAQSLEINRSEVSPEYEYFTWIDRGKEILHDMTDGHVSAADLNERNDFLKDSWQRESEMLTCLGLYERSDNPLAKQKCHDLRYRLQRLRQIRSSILTLTKDRADKTLSPEEIEEIKRRYRLLNAMRTLEIPAPVDKELAHESWAHERDLEFVAGYSFYTRMLEDIRRAELQKSRDRELVLMEAYSNAPDEYLLMLRHKDDTKETISDRLARLSGRKVSSPEKEEAVRTLKRTRLFDAAYYNQLINQRESVG